MVSELQALERVERTGEKPNETQKAFQSEYLKLVQLQTDKPSGNVIFLEAPTQTDKAIDKADKPAEQQGPKTPIERLEKAVEQYGASRTLTPELQKEFEGIVTDSDKPSTRIPELERKIEGLADEAKKIFPKEKQDEAKALQTAMDEQVQALSEDQQQGLVMMMFLRNLAPPDERKEVDDAIEKIAPGLMEKSNKLQTLMAPVREKLDQAMELQQEIELEKKADVMSRIIYAEVLLDSGNEKGAQKFIREASNKDQKLLDSEYFVDLAERAGLKRKDLILLRA